MSSNADTVPTRKAYVYPFERAERAAVGLYPILMFTHGAFVANIMFLLLLCGSVSLIWVLGNPYEAAHYLGEAIAAAVVAFAAYALYGRALVRLGRVACAATTLFFGVTLIWAIAGDVLAIAAQPDLSDLISLALAFALTWWVLITLTFGWAQITRATDQDRHLLRAPFQKLFTGAGIQYFSGLPPIVRFTRSAAARSLILISSVFFSVAFLMLVQPANQVGHTADLYSRVLLLIVPIVIVPVAAVIANSFLRWGRNRIRFSIEQIKKADPRAPVLFLRAFRDDQVTLPNPRHNLLGRLMMLAMPQQSLDELLLDEGTLYGPMVALGNPGDRLPPYGSARGYITHDRWQEVVTALAHDAIAIVICVDDTESIWWEIRHLIHHDHLAKTCFLIHPKFKKTAQDARIVGRLFNEFSVGEEAILQQENSSLRGTDVIGFYFGAEGDLYVGKSDSFTKFSYLLMVRWFFRHRFGLPKID